MRALFVPGLIVFLGITLISSKPLEDSKNREELRSLNKTERDKMIKDLRLLEKWANETYLAKEPTSGEPKDPTEDETYLSKDPTAEGALPSKDPLDQETDLTKDPTAEQTKDATGNSGKEEVSFVEEDEEEHDEATVDKPTDAQPENFLKYPEHEEDFKPYPRFAILRNGYIHRMNLEF